MTNSIEARVKVLEYQAKEATNTMGEISEKQDTQMELMRGMDVNVQRLVTESDQWKVARVAKKKSTATWKYWAAGIAAAIVTPTASTLLLHLMKGIL